jgi:outer membrane protein insertion porin family
MMKSSPTATRQFLLGAGSTIAAICLIAPQAIAQAPPTPAPKPSPAATPAPIAPKILVAEVQVSGATGELAEAVYGAIKTRVGEPTTRSQLQADIGAIVNTGRFAKVAVQPEDTTLGVRITFVVEPNPVLKTVEIPGRKVLPDRVIAEAFKSQYGQTLNRRSIESAVQTIDKWYKDQGYVLAQIVSEPTIAPDGVVTIEVAEGVVEAIKIQPINEQGEDKDANGKAIKLRTREFVITREMETKPGEVFNRTKAERDLGRIAGLQIFKDLKLGFEPGQDPRQVVVVVQPVEKVNISASPGGTWGSRNGFAATGNLQAGNVGGNNQKLNADVEVGNRNLAFDLSFTDPWIAGDPYRTSYTANLFRRSNTSLNFEGGEPEVRLANGDRPRILRTGGGISFSRPLSKQVFERSQWYASAGLQYQQITLQDADRNRSAKDALGNDLTASGTGRDSFLTVPLALSQDRRNSVLSPTSGSMLRLSSEQSIPLSSGSPFANTLQASYSTYLPTRLLRLTPGCQTAKKGLAPIVPVPAADCPQAFAFNLKGGTVLGKLPPYNAFSLGGSNSVRGYEDGEVASARSFLQASAEYRFPVFSIIRGALFVDAATDLGSSGSVTGDPGGARNKSGSGFGYGVGTRIQSPIGPIRLDYGWNDRGESKLHFGLGERF